MIEIGGRLINPDHVSVVTPWMFDSNRATVIVILKSGMEIEVAASYDEVKAALTPGTPPSTGPR